MPGRNFNIDRHLLPLVVSALFMVGSSLYLSWGLPWWQILASVVSVLVVAYSVYRFTNLYASGFNHAIPFIFVILAFSLPDIITFSKESIAPILFILSVYYSVKFSYKSYQNDLAFIVTFFLTCSAILFPPLVWCSVIFLISNYVRAEKRLKYVVMSLCGIIVPVLLYFGATYIFFGFESVRDTAVAMYDKMISISGFNGEIIAATLFKLFVLSVMAIASIIVILRNLNTFNISRHRAMIRGIVYLIFLIADMVLFSSVGTVAFWCSISALLTIIYYDALCCHIENRTGVFVLVFFLCAILAERTIALMVA
mgnify:CR=1 FL=1